MEMFLILIIYRIINLLSDFYLQSFIIKLFQSDENQYLKKNVCKPMPQSTRDTSKEHTLDVTINEKDKPVGKPLA